MPDIRTYVAAPVAVLMRRDWLNVIDKIERLVGPPWVAVLMRPWQIEPPALSPV